MARSNHRYLLVAVAVATTFLAVVAETDPASSSVGFDIHHRFSPVVRRWAQARGHPAPQWPAHGSPAYYSALSRHDRSHLARRRGLAGADALVTFADGNDTYSLGYLYYAAVAVGTPNTTFLVALDTGSDLFWVPCDCKQCAPLPTNNDTSSPQLRPYTPTKSSTSTPVGCGNALCNQPNGCSAATNGSCPYTVRYVSPNTSTSGVLVQDVLHLTRERPGPGAAAAEALQAPVVFGCGQVQTGLFLDGAAAFDGLMGLGMDKVSVPSVLAANGLVASDSFSMCFGDDGTGRISFGDAGSGDQAETPFITTSTFPTYYNVSFTSINVGGKSAPVEFAAVMDSGTSFTHLNDPEYTELATNFDSQIREKRTTFSTGTADPFPFEYCYNLSANQTEVFLPDVSLTTNGGAQFPVTQPIVVIVNAGNTSSGLIGYCLAIMKSDISINIVGQNFMTGLKVVFDRERSVLGWHKFDCYKNAVVADPSPAAAGGLTKLTPQQNVAGGRYPGAAALPASAGPRSAASELWLMLSMSLLLGAATLG